MRLASILRPGYPMLPGERRKRLAEWLAQKIAARLPYSVRYWTFVQLGVQGIGDRVVPEVTVLDALRALPTPRASA